MTHAPIRARPADWAVASLRGYVRRSAARHFHAWHLGGDGLDAVRDVSRPLLFVPNHTAWWDGFFGLMLAEQLSHRYFVMMQADQLAAIPFFARCGAFSVDLTDARQAARDLDYAATLLMPGNGVWVFPQGRRMPAMAPISVASGAARLALLRPGTRIVPVGLRYTFLSEELPEAFAWVGTPFELAPSEGLGMVRRRIRSAMADTLDQLDAVLVADERRAFTPLIQGAPSSNKRMTALLARLGLAPREAVRNG